MSTKMCTKCSQVKSLDLFHKNKNQCKVCRNAYEKERQKKTREQINKLAKQRYAEKKEKGIFKEIIVRPELYKKCTSCNIEKSQTEFYKSKSRGCLRSWCKKCTNIKSIANAKANKDKVAKRRAIYTAEKERRDPVYKLQRKLRNRLYHAFKAQGLLKKQRTQYYIGCTPKFLKEWLEFQLYDGMTAENYGKFWHIDHCKPCTMFDFSNEDEVKECFNWSNLRPLLAHKNRVKYNSYNIRDSLFQEIKQYAFLKIKT